MQFNFLYTLVCMYQLSEADRRVVRKALNRNLTKQIFIGDCTEICILYGMYWTKQETSDGVLHDGLLIESGPLLMKTKWSVSSFYIAESAKSHSAMQLVHLINSWLLLVYSADQYLNNSKLQNVFFGSKVARCNNILIPWVAIVSIHTLLHWTYCMRGTFYCNVTWWHKCLAAMIGQ